MDISTTGGGFHCYASYSLPILFLNVLSSLDKMVHFSDIHKGSGFQFLVTIEAILLETKTKHTKKAE